MFFCEANMLTINLLSPAEKKWVWYEEVRRIVRFFAVGIALACILAAILLFPARLSLSLEKQELKRSLRIEEEASQSLNINAESQKIQEMKTRIRLIRDFASTPPTASPLLKNFFANTDEGIMLSSLTVKKQGDVVITGNAATRRDLLRFEKTLRDANLFQELAFPLSNIVRETNINFTMQGKLKSPHTL